MTAEIDLMRLRRDRAYELIRPKSGGQRATWPSCEADLGPPIIAHLQDLQWDVYQEVQVAQGDDVADIIAVQGRLVWAIELKRSLSFEVIAQAARWHRYCHYASVAVPAPSRTKSKGRYLAEEVLSWKGIGMLQVMKPGDFVEPMMLERQIAPRLNRRPWVIDRIRDWLSPEHKTYARAGNADGQRWTPFMRTCQAVAETVARKPGIAMKELVDAISHHYASDAGARAHLATWIDAGKVPGVELRRDGRRLQVWPCEKRSVE